ncbi:uncharacterized protein LOC134711654 [Mytilus trossulus]|uniref:uncharacterized protein LOC134711654 n=1 Tax=Mytilus trossulus TaxID=6551 RepID=UPI00300585DA
MASSKPIPCGPCEEGKVYTKADIWCNNCDEGLCSTCLSHHKKCKGTRDHKTIDINYKPLLQAIKTECDKHDKQLHLYCPSHLIPCCDECISRSHSKCTGIKSLTSVVEKTNVEKSKESVERDIKFISRLFEKNLNKKLSNIKTGEQQCESIKESIFKVRENINKHLDRLEKKIWQEADGLLDYEKSTATSFVTEIEEENTNLQTMEDHLQSVTTHTSKLQSFLGVHQIQQQLHAYQRYAEDIENDDRANKFDIKMKQNDVIENIQSQLESLESLGEVAVVQTETSLNRETNVRRYPQVESQEQPNINNITMNIKTSTDINMKMNISDMICLMDGRVLVAELYGNVNLFTSGGKLQKQLPIYGGAYSVIQINHTVIAITYPLEKAIKIFNMENETVIRCIPLDKKCYGLSFYNNSLAVGLSLYKRGTKSTRGTSNNSLVEGVNDNEIRIIDFEENTQKSLKVQSTSPLWHLVYCYNRVIYSDYKGNAVNCVDGSGKQIWQYTQDLSGPRGLSTDTCGNIIVADYYSNRIILISKDGKGSKVLTNPEDGIEKPRCIYFKHNESLVFSCDCRGKYLAKFGLSSE